MTFALSPNVALVPYEMGRWSYRSYLVSGERSIPSLLILRKDIVIVSVLLWIDCGTKR